MLDFSDFFNDLRRCPLLLRREKEYFEQKFHENCDPNRDGHIENWSAILQKLPAVEKVTPYIQNGILTFDTEADEDLVRELFEEFIPWRKGPYLINNVFIDTEWRSDYKWDRIKDYITPLENRRVLDVGCGSGYHGWRMALDGASFVLGIEPGLLSVCQYMAVKHFSRAYPFHVIPLTLEEFPSGTHAFDTVFSMGVLYHRRSPFEHLLDLKRCLKSKGELVLETLVVDGGLHEAFVPEDRYAKMRNVWFLPSPETLEFWLKRCGFVDIKMVDCTVTTIKEQRATSWTFGESLVDYLDPNDHSKTIEGYPAPKRATFIAHTK